MYQTFPPSRKATALVSLSKKCSVFQHKTINPSNPQWDSVAAGNAAWADTVTGNTPSRATYNYYVSADPDSLGYVLPAGLKFIPQIFGDTGTTFGSEQSSANLAIAQTIANSSSGTGELLTYNEPNQVGQANMTPARAAQLWPAVRSTGLRVGAPAMGWRINTAIPTWLADFVTALGSADFDFIPIDVYAESFTNPDGEAAKIVSFMNTLYTTYNKPIWLKEFGVINFGSLPSQPTDAQVKAYMLATIRTMPSYVERYFWYRIGPGKDATASQYFNIGLYNTDGSRTAIGEYYRSPI